MPRATFSELDRDFGSDNVAKMAAAYETALLWLMEKQQQRVVEREERLAIVTAIVAEAKRGRFDPEHLTRTALAVASRPSA